MGIFTHGKFAFGGKNNFVTRIYFFMLERKTVKFRFTFGAKTDFIGAKKFVFAKKSRLLDLQHFFSVKANFFYEFKIKRINIFLSN